MARARVPPELRQGPFTVGQANKVGITRWQLAGDAWQRVAHGTYVRRSMAHLPETRLESALMRLPSSAVFSGRTAAWLHGLDVDLGARIDVTLPAGAGVSGRAGLALRRVALPEDDVVEARGYRATSICRTLRDLAGRATLTEGVVYVDMALNAGLIHLGGLVAWAAKRRGTTGIASLRRAIAHAEPAAESPMETRLRMLLVLRGLPRPVAQHVVRDRDGSFLGRVDLFYPEHRLGIEYDGATHRDSLPEDDRRQNRLLSAGVRLLRFTADDLQRNPHAVVAQVAAQLHQGPQLHQGALAGKRAPDIEIRRALAGKRASGVA